VPVPETLASIYAGKEPLQNLIVSAGRDIGSVVGARYMLSLEKAQYKKLT